MSVASRSQRVVLSLSRRRRAGFGAGKREQKIGYEIKFSSAPKVTKGFWLACEDTGVDKAYVVAPVQEGWAMANIVEVVPPFRIRLH